MPTLQYLKKEEGLTNRDIARALNCSIAKAGMIMQGRHIKTFTDKEIAQLAQVLSNYHVVTFERCWLAMCESYNQWNGTPGKEHQRADEVRAKVQNEMGFPVDEPRSMVIDGSVVVAEDHRIGR